MWVTFFNKIGAVALLVSPLSYSAGNRNFGHPWENHRQGKNFVGKDHTTNIWGLGAIC
jgi:hypothetical protein